MGLINLTDRQKQAIAGIDERQLNNLVYQAVDSGHMGQISGLALDDCGDYVSIKVRYFERALAACRIAKSAKKREATLYSARKSSDDLIFAVSQMKRRLDDEQRDGESFYVLDGSMPPLSLTDNMNVHVNYRWRRTTGESWTSGSILFEHKARPRYVYRELSQQKPKPKQKPTARKLVEDRENELRQEWEYLDMLAHTSVREYFRAGLDGADIPDVFGVTVSDSGCLNNFSADFWGRKLRS